MSKCESPAPMLDAPTVAGCIFQPYLRLPSPAPILAAQDKVPAQKTQSEGMKPGVAEEMTQLRHTAIPVAPHDSLPTSLPTEHTKAKTTTLQIVAPTATLPLASSQDASTRVAAAAPSVHSIGNGSERQSATPTDVSHCEREYSVLTIHHCETDEASVSSSCQPCAKLPFNPGYVAVAPDGGDATTAHNACERVASPVHTTLAELEDELQLDGINMDHLLSHDGHSLSRTLNATEQHLRENCVLRIFGLPLPWLIAVLQALVPLGRYYAYDIPGSISTQLKSHFNGDLSSSDILSFYSLVSFPSVVMCIVAGAVQKRVGIQQACLIYSVLIFLGQMLFTVGIQVQSYPLACIGRFVFGLGCDSICISRAAYLLRWLSGPQFALAFAMQVAIGRVGSTAAFAVLPAMADVSVNLALWIATGLCVLCILMNGLANWLDGWATQKIQRARQRLLSVIEQRHASELCILKLPSDNEPSHPLAFAESVSLSLSLFAKVPRSVWLFCIMNGVWYVCGLGFFFIASSIMQNSGRHLSAATASLYVAIPNMVSLVVLPLWGRVVDKTGKAIWWTAASSFLLTLVQIPFFLLANGQVDFDPWWLMILHGCAYSIGCAVLWVPIAYVTKEDVAVYNLSMGLQFSSMDLALALTPFIIGAIQNDWPQWQYTSPSVLFIISTAVAGVLACLLVLYDDRRANGLLNSTQQQRQLYLQKKEELEQQQEQDEQQHKQAIPQPPQQSPHEPTTTNPLSSQQPQTNST